MKTSPEALEQLFQALSDRTRIRLLNLMIDGEICVCFFVEVLGEPQPKISRHLAYLRNAGLVGTRREAKWMHYRITEPEHPAARQDRCAEHVVGCQLSVVCQFRRKMADNR
jgi:ArsR family transcriptional regulator